MPCQRDTVPIDSGILAIHIALLPGGAEGEVLLLGGDEHDPSQAEDIGGDFRETRMLSSIFSLAALSARRLDHRTAMCFVPATPTLLMVGC
jgi:hypothetical protein